MPFKSEKQRRYMHANLPEIAQRWERDYASGGIARVGYQQGMGVAPFPPPNDLGNPLNDSRIVSEERSLLGHAYPTNLEGNWWGSTSTEMLGDQYNLPMDRMINPNDMSGALAAPYGVNPMTGMPYQKPRTIADQNRVHGQTFTQRQPAWYNQMFNKAGQGITGLKNQMGNMFSGAKHKAGALAGNLMGMAMGIPGLGALLGNIRPDNPYEIFQKQMFGEMYRDPKTGKPANFGNKDPFGKNIRSLFGNYDVVKQADKFAGSKLSQKYADKHGYKGNLFADLMADGEVTDEEIEQYGLKNMGNYQLNRLRALAHAKKQATDWYDKTKRPPGLGGSKPKGDGPTIFKTRTTGGGGSGPTYGPHTPTHHGTKAHGPGGRFDVSNRSSSKSSSSGSGRRGSHHFAQGGLASLWPR